MTQKLKRSHFGVLCRGDCAGVIKPVIHGGKEAKHQGDQGGDKSKQGGNAHGAAVPAFYTGAQHQAQTHETYFEGTKLQNGECGNVFLHKGEQAFHRAASFCCL